MKNFSNFNFKKWNEKTRIEKKKTVFKWVLGFIYLAGLVVTIFASEIFGDSDFADELGGYSAIGQWFVDNLSIIFKSIISLFVYLLIARAVAWIYKVIVISSRHGKSVHILMSSMIRYLIYTIMIFNILSIWGVDATGLIASAGVIGIVIGLGAQSLIADILSGIFIVFEHQFDIGDIVTIDNFRGEVIDIGIRTTKIKSGMGDIQIINNSKINKIINMSNEMTYVLCDIGIEYSESLEKVEKIINANIAAISKRVEKAISPPVYAGVSELGSSAVMLRIIAGCNEKDKFEVSRQLNREFKLLFDKYHINIPYPQIVINQPPHISSTKNVKKNIITKQKPIKKVASKSSNNKKTTNKVASKVTTDSKNK